MHSADQSCPWVDSRVGLVWVGSRWVHYSKTAKKIRKGYVSAFKAQLDKRWLQQAVKFDFTAERAHLTGTGNRSDEVEEVDAWLNKSKR